MPARSVCLTVSVCAPEDSALEVIVQLPSPAAVVVPSTVVPSVSYRVTVAPGSALPPVTVGVVTLVRLSVLEAPLSLAVARSGAEGAKGAAISTVTTSDAEAALTLPARSVCLTVSVCAPADSALAVIDQLPSPPAVAVPSTVVPSVSYSVTVAPDSAPLPVTVGVVSFVRSSVLEAPLSLAGARSGAEGAKGAAVSMVTTSDADAALVLPARSVCLAVSVCAPDASALAVIDQLPSPPAVVVPSTVVPSVSYSVTVAPGSAPPPVTVGVVALVRLSLFEAPLSLAAARSGSEGA